jgi:hypothetical protein
MARQRRLAPPKSKSVLKVGRSLRLSRGLFKGLPSLADGKQAKKGTIAKVINMMTEVKK